MKRLRVFTSAATYCPHFKKLRGSFAPYDKIENYAIKGPVIKLQREEGASFGMVTILAPVEGRTRKVTLALSEPLPEGTMAHHQHHYVQAVGTLAREPRTYRLENPVNFDLATDDEDDVDQLER